MDIEEIVRAVILEMLYSDWCGENYLAAPELEGVKRGSFIEELSGHMEAD